MKFKDFFKKRRKELHLTQADFMPDYTQSYISRIEGGKYPNNEDTYYVLAKYLKMEGDRAADYLWAYARFDADPREYFAIDPLEEDTQALAVYEDGGDYSHEHREVSIELNATETDVVSILGPPDKRMRIPSRIKWIYQSEGLHVIFAGGRVVDVMFK